MRSVSLALAAGIWLVVSATSLPAQDAPRGRGASPEGRGPGTRFPAFPAAQPSRSSIMGLTELRQVQTELGLTPEQQQKLDELRSRTIARQQELYDEMQRQAAELNRQADQAAQQLLDEKQGTRVSQLRLQREGLPALSRPEIADKLQLTPEQRSKLEPLILEYRRGGRFGRDRGRPAADAPANPAPATRQQGFGPRSRESLEQVEKEILAVLTPEQQAKWAELRGAEFEFPSPFTPPRGFGPRISSSRTAPFELGQNTDRLPPGLGRRVVLSRLGPLGPLRYGEIVDALQLTAEQKARIQSIAAEDVKASEQARSLDGGEQSSRLEQINQATQEKLDGVLTAEQKAKIEELSGTTRAPQR